MEICQSINFPVSLEKTFWATTRITFLGLLIDTVHQLVCVPCDKVEKAKQLINHILQKESEKITLHQLQSITGFLNFLCKAVTPGRTFTRRLYSVMEGAQNKLRCKHHHINLTKDMRLDLETWVDIPQPSKHICQTIHRPEQASVSYRNRFLHRCLYQPRTGMWGISDKDWFIMQWNEQFVAKKSPSINYLELYAVTVAVMSWIYKYKNQRVIIFCDKMSVVNMINNSTSRCKNYMVLLRILILHALTNNVKVNAKHVPGKLNIYSDLLSRLKYKQFWLKARTEGRKFNNQPTLVPEMLSMPELWIEEDNVTTSSTFSEEE